MPYWLHHAMASNQRRSVIMPTTQYVRSCVSLTATVTPRRSVTCEVSGSAADLCSLWGLS